MKNSLLLIFLAVFILAVFISRQREYLPPPPIACTQEAKLCPDGSAVGRIGPNCEFAECPGVPPSPTPTPTPSSFCTKDSDCPSSAYLCEAREGYGTVEPNGGPSTFTITKGECKLKEGNRCSASADCAGGLLCYNRACTAPVGRQCAGPTDASCPSGFECVQGCGPPVARESDPPPPYFCQLKGYERPCPICLALGTKIATPGGEVAVEKITVGAIVWSVDLAGNKVAVPVVKIGKTLVPPTHKVVRLVLSDGRELFVSAGHPTADGRLIGDLRPGDILDGARVVSTDRIPYAGGFTYDILPTDPTGLYYANGILIGSTLK